MCFSAGASFGAGIVLSAIGIASLRKAQNKDEVIFAGIPLIFAVQQITEGFLWLALSDSFYSSVRWPATYIFLFFAQVVWPFWVPYSIFKLEKEKRTKKALGTLTAVGSVVSLYLAYCLLSYHVEANILGLHISYKQVYPQALSKYGGLLYLTATIFSPFLSTIKRMWILGSAILISYIITSIFYTDYIVSVWCFFASVISVAVYAIMLQIKKLNKEGLLINIEEKLAYHSTKK